MKNRKKRNKTKQNYNKANTIVKTVPAAPKYVYKGLKNETKFPEFVQLCKYTQEDLKEILPYRLIKAGYSNVIKADGYIYAKGTMPYLLTAHMDTVHKEPVKDFYEYTNEKGEHIISSPQGIGGDDRCGIYMILEIIKEFKPSILFCEDEEIGGVGSDKFCATEFINELADLKFLIELDRANGKDAVFYDCDNKDFTKFITENTGYKETWGSFSDISNLAPACRVAAVNLSCGYYNAHTLSEEVNVEEMLNTIDTVKYLLQVESEQFEYIECKRYGYGYGYGYGSYYGRYSSSYWDDFDDDDWYDNYYSKYKSTSKSTTETKEDKPFCVLEVMYEDIFDEECYTFKAYGATEAEAWVNFFKENPTVCYNQVLDWDEAWY